MATRSCREKAQKQNEQHQAILAKLLREEDNKYCADCEAKAHSKKPLKEVVVQDGPLGTPVFLFASDVLEYIEILGSIYQGSSLSTWTSGHQSKYSACRKWEILKQGYSMKLICQRTSEDLKQITTCRAVEFFIRDKYEKKKYYDKNAINAFNSSAHVQNYSQLVQKLHHIPGTRYGRDGGVISSSDAAQPLASSPSLQAAAEKSKAEPQKKEDQQSEAKASPKKSSEPTIDLLGLAMELSSREVMEGQVSRFKSTSTKPTAATLSAASGDLDLFTEQTTKSEESTKKQLSKDSILSLYGTGTMQQQNAPGMFMGSSSMPFTTQPSTHFQGFPAMGVPVPAAAGMMGNMMGQSVPVMGQSTGVMVGMGMPNGFTGTTQTGVMGLPQNVVGPQGGMVGQMVTPQNKFGLQQNQQAQWNLSQMNQQMAGMNLSSSSTAMGFGQPPSTAAGWTGSSSGQTLSTQLWK
ncbi:Smap1 [Columba livia]|nr:Smap1 [Columba livia]